ncbi:hypothetical protein ABLT31_14375 [Ammoniphilus sp. 3BR4]
MPKANTIEQLKTIGEPQELDPNESYSGRIVNREASWNVSVNHYSVTVFIIKIVY